MVLWYLNLTVVFIFRFLTPMLIKINCLNFDLGKEKLLRYTLG